MTPTQKRISERMAETCDGRRYTVEVREHDWAVEVYAKPVHWFNPALQVFVGKRGGLRGSVLGQPKRLKGREMRIAWAVHVER